MKNLVLYHVIRMTKLFTYAFLIQCLSMSILFASNGNAQVKDIDEVMVSLTLEDTKIEKVFSSIEKMTGYIFVYTDKELKNMPRVTTGRETQSVYELLSIIGRQTGLNFKQVNQNIHVRRSAQRPDQMEDLSIKDALVDITISGTVTDGNGDPLPGATISVRGTSVGTVTNLDGKYSINAPEGSTLVFSYIGYASQSVEVRAQSTVDITLNEDQSSLEEIVVVGYGTQKKSDLTGSVVRADIEAFRESPNVNIAQSLQGTVPGLNVGQVNRAGQNPSISVRGRTTLSGNRDVLLVVDGIIFTGSLSDLNPNDVESVDVLKDASSMAIFGAQAANGVILITTKGGKKGTKPVFNYSSSFTTQNPTNTLSLLDRDGFIKKSFDIDWETAYMAPEYTELKPGFSYSDVVNNPALREGYENGNNYDWWDNTTSPGFISSHNLGVRGSTEDLSYFISGGYTKQEGFVMNDQFERITTRINLENQILSWFKVGAQTFGSFSDFSGEIPSLSGISTMAPLVTPRDENGNFILNPNQANTDNPYLIASGNDFDKRNNLFGNFYADMDIPFIDGLNFRLNFGNNYSWNRHYNSNDYSSGATGGAFKRNRHSYDWTLDNILNYKKTLNEIHNFDFTFVAGRRERRFEQTSAEGSNYNNLRLGYNDLSLAGMQTIHSAAWDESFLYQMARLNYEFNYKYQLTATVRRDGFSGFSDQNKFAVFPSLGFGWIISEERFLENSIINNLKFRGSYGTNGNLVDRYSSIARMSIYPAYVFGDGGSTVYGQQVVNLANTDLSWETTTGFNFGLDFAFYRNRFSGSLDYYTTTTNDLIYNVVIPEITGFNQITSNIGEIANRGIEFILNSRVISTGNLIWNVNFNIASNRNRIGSLLGLDADGDGVEDDLVASGLFIGQSINTIFDYESEGIIQLGEEAPSGFFVGTHKIVDQNGDGIIDPNDRAIIGREEPSYNFGVLNEFHYKGFSLRIFINSIQGVRNGYLGRNQAPLQQGDNARRNNFWNEVDYWTPSNPNARYRRLDQGPAIEYIYYGDRSFVRLQDVTLAYRFNQTLVDRLGIQGLKVFASGKNLGTWTNWEGWDPETGSGLDRSGLPVMRGVSLGLDFSF
ncbi:MAG TPA: TonB-dependent receptor [Lunatimonas sp.]|nr:TonB-dependent receptor [Lunatimonas sp.]